MPNPTSRIVHLPEERDMDRLIKVAKYGAKRDNVTVVIERRVADRRTPLLQVSPDGRVKAIPASTLRVTVKDRLRASANINRNVAATKGLARFSSLGAEAERVLAADDRRQKQKGKAVAA
jgi:hypothetical protein